MGLVASAVVDDRRGGRFQAPKPKGQMMGSSIRTIVRRTVESPAGGLVTALCAWAVVWPWLSRRRHTPATA
jgi:hypothetical protein